jgi:toxin YxiD
LRMLATNIGLNAFGFKAEMKSIKELLEQRAVSNGARSKVVFNKKIKNIQEFIEGNKHFEEVVNDYANLYAEIIKSNKPWSWGEDILGGENLTLKQKRQIKEVAISESYIAEVKVTKVEGMRYGFADFAGAGLVEETLYIPEKYWRLSDKEQFKWLDDKIGGHREGMTWHHTEVPGKMELVPYGIHNIIPHNGGRTTGLWADAPR